MKKSKPITTLEGLKLEAAKEYVNDLLKYIDKKDKTKHNGFAYIEPKKGTERLVIPMVNSCNHQKQTRLGNKIRKALHQITDKRNAAEKYALQ